ncbi:cysteine desulfurase [Candidatus Saccharibacteria bacterium]|nr:cysteine desulfurase [Candidatus Saccharibacteria bacterium]
MSGDFLYLDYAAATPVDEHVRAVMQPYFSANFFNPSSPYAPAVQVRREYDAAKSRLAATFGAKGDELVITAGATESINLAFHGISGHVVTSAIEHHAVITTAQQYNHTFVQPTKQGIITAEAITAALQPATQLVSIQLANNEIGTIQPLKEISLVVAAERARRALAGETTPLYLHTDASQGFGHIDVHVARLGVDMITLNSGKMYGPKQVGLLWLKPGVTKQPLIFGGGQERGLRSGTENVAGVVGFSEAAVLATTRRPTEATRLAKLRDTLQATLCQRFPSAVVSGHAKRRLPGTLHIAFPDLDGERLVFRLEARGVLVATGSACAANKGTRSHVLEAIGLPAEIADGSLRITLGRLSDEETMQRAAEIIGDEVAAEYERVHRD